MRQLYDKIAKELAESATQLTNCGLMRGWAGQLSTRSIKENDYSIVLKSSGGSPDDPEAYCQVDSCGKNPVPPNSRPSLVTRVHCAIYKACPNVHAVIQCRGHYADAIAIVLGKIPLCLETYWALKAEPVVLDMNELRSDTFDQFAGKMAVAVSNVMSESGRETTVVCIPFYGIWVTGSSISEAVLRALALEDLAKSVYLRLELAKNFNQSNPEFPSWFREMLQELPRPSSDRGDRDETKSVR